MRTLFTILIGVTSLVFGYNHAQEFHPTLPLFTASLEETLAKCPFPVIEGFMTEGQKKQFNDKLREYGQIDSILEIGLNAGHSADNFLKQCPELKVFLSVDIYYHSYAAYAANYLQTTYPGKFIPLVGDSQVTLPLYAHHFSSNKFDLIFIDGGHLYEYCLGDISNCSRMAHEGTHLWIDDYNFPPVRMAVDKAIELGIIEVLAIHEDPVAERSWAEARYINPLAQF